MGRRCSSRVDTPARLRCVDRERGGRLLSAERDRVPPIYSTRIEYRFFRPVRGHRALCERSARVYPCSPSSSRPRPAQDPGARAPSGARRRSTLRRRAHCRAPSTMQRPAAAGGPRQATGARRRAAGDRARVRLRELGAAQAARRGHDDRARREARCSRGGRTGADGSVARAVRQRRAAAVPSAALRQGSRRCWGSTAARARQAVRRAPTGNEHDERRHDRQ